MVSLFVLMKTDLMRCVVTGILLLLLLVIVVEMMTLIVISIY